MNTKQLQVWILKLQNAMLACDSNYDLYFRWHEEAEKVYFKRISKGDKKCAKKLN